MGMTNEQYESVLRTLFFNARKAQIAGESLDDFIISLEATVGENIVGIVNEKIKAMPIHQKS